MIYENMIFLIFNLIKSIDCPMCTEFFIINFSEHSIPEEINNQASLLKNKIY